MIKYKTQVGSKHMIQEARELRDTMKRNLTGMHCRKCKTVTIVSFVVHGYNHLKPEIKACCFGFEQRIGHRMRSE